MNVQLLKLLSGEMIIADVLSEEADFITVENPCMIIPQKDTLGFSPLLPFANTEKVAFKPDHVMFIVGPAEELVTEFNRIFGAGIIIAPANAIK
jgi:hypothetical protein